jgi:glycosyltransferase involved in cell wall biosynthesis
MTILVINWQDKNNPFAGGAETHLHEIFSRIVQRGHTVILLACRFHGAAEEELLDDGIYVVRRGSRSLFNFAVPGTYFQLRRRFRPDLVVDDINKIPFWTPLYVREPLLCVAHHFFGRSIFREVDPLRGAYVYTAEHVMPWVYRREYVAVVSESTRDEFLARGFAHDRVRVIYNGIDHAAFPMRVGEKSPTPMITYFGRIKRYKCPDHLLMAFAQIADQFPTAQLYFVGDGDYLPALQRQAATLGIAHRVQWTGRVSNEEKIAYLSRSWCVVNTSMKEGWGITTIEANACGTPVIAADVPGLRDSVADGKSGLLYPFADVDQLARTIARLLDDHRLRDRLSRGAIEWAWRFSWEESANRMLELCQEVTETLPPSR